MASRGALGLNCAQGCSQTQAVRSHQLQGRPAACRGLRLDGRAAARAAIREAHAAGARICAFFCESILSCAGQVRP